MATSNLNIKIAPEIKWVEYVDSLDSPDFVKKPRPKKKLINPPSIAPTTLLPQTPVAPPPPPKVKNPYNHAGSLPWHERGLELSKLFDNFQLIIDKEHNGIFSDAALAANNIPIHPQERPDLAGAFGDYYLLEAIVSGVFLNPRTPNTYDLESVKDKARAELKALVDRCSPIFLNYFRMIVWGEARYHQSIQKEYGNQNRAYGWWMTSHIESVIGPDAYKDVQLIFLELGNGGVGGKKWANIADTVHARLTDKLDAFTFMDRAFHLQHNGGCAFNKIEWPVNPRTSWDFPVITSILGPAQALKVPNLAPLFLVASPATQSLWKAHIREGNKAALSVGHQPVWDRVSGILPQYYHKNHIGKFLQGELKSPVLLGRGTITARKADINKQVRARTTLQNRSLQKRETVRRNQIKRMAQKAATAKRREERRIAAIEAKLTAKQAKLLEKDNNDTNGT